MGGVAEDKKRNEKNRVFLRESQRKKDGLCNAAKKLKGGIAERE